MTDEIWQRREELELLLKFKRTPNLVDLTDREKRAVDGLTRKGYFSGNELSNKGEHLYETVLRVMEAYDGNQSF